MRHGRHQLAQKSMSTYLPFSSESFITLVLSAFMKASSGALLPMLVPTWTLPSGAFSDTREAKP